MVHAQGVGFLQITAIHAPEPVARKDLHAIHLDELL